MYYITYIVSLFNSIEIETTSEFILVMFLFKSPTSEKIIFMNRDFFYKSKKLPLDETEYKILRTFVLFQGRVENTDFLDLFNDTKVDLSNRIRQKNLKLQILEAKLQGLLWTNEGIFIRRRNKDDRRSFMYELNLSFFEILGV